MKKLILILLLATGLFGQWRGWTEWNTWINKNIPPSIADWKWNVNVTTVDTGTTVIKSLVSNWVSTNGKYDAQQATISLSPIYDTANKALIFDGVDDLLSISYSNSAVFRPSPKESFSIAWWGEISSPNYSTVFSVGWRGVDGYQVYWRLAGELRFHFKNNAYQAWYGLDNSNTHFYVIVVKSNGTKWQTVELFVDGVSNGSKDISTLNDVTYSQDLRIGAGYSGGVTADYYGGNIKEIMFFNKNLLPYQIRYIYNKGMPQ